MKIVIASDSFKESMTSIEACHAIEKGIKAVDPDINCLCLPMADGGEGTTEVLMSATNSTLYSLNTFNPFHEVINATYGMNKAGTAIMETASTCGIDLIPRELRDPTRALSTGLGEMIKDAVNKGAKEIIIGLGGSGTNDGGFGMLYALGAKFYDIYHKLLPLSFDSILKIESIDLSEINLNGCQIIAASDVDNVFTGPQGATYVFAQQKGASSSQQVYLEECLCHLQHIINYQYHIDLKTIAKTGSAGGIGGALYLLGAQMVSGIDMVLKVTEFEKHIQDASYIFTGEGSIDHQTIEGKTISGIARIAKKHNVPVIALAGKVTKEAENLNDIGVTAMFSITNEAKSLSQALKDGKEFLTFTTMNICKLIL